MRGVSREAWASVHEYLETVLGAGADPTVLGQELFAVTDVLASTASLRRALTDPSRGAEARAALVERRRHGPLPLHFAGAGGTSVQVLFQAVFLFRHQLAVEIEGNQLGNRIASHTQSPNSARIFRVARKRQFLAASSVVPSRSPMFRRRRPW